MTPSSSRLAPRKPPAEPTVVARRASTVGARPRRSRVGFVVAMLASAAVATGITLIAVTGSRTSSPGAAIEPPPPAVALEPIVVGGGSAIERDVVRAEHVAAGPNAGIGKRTSRRGGDVVEAEHVAAGPNAGIGKQTSRRGAAPERAIDFDPKRFDALGYLPKARALARQIYPDADFTEFELYENVLPDGRVDLTLPVTSASYFEFRSPAHSRFPADRKPGAELACYVMVEVTATAVRARVRDDDKCDHPLRRPPRCSLAEVWRRVGARATIGNVPATIGFLSDGTWFFDPDHANTGSGSSRLTSFGDCR